MIRYLSGILAEVGETEIVVEVQGMGYAVNVPVSMIEKLPGAGGQIKLYTYLSVREDAMQLFGFLSREDLQMYKLLISVNGIGPRAGMGIMGSLSGEDIRMAVVSEDAKTIAKAPGIGPKTAKKVILELKDKIDIEAMTVGAVGEEPHGAAASGGGAIPEGRSAVVQDAVEALVVLGYPRTDAARAVRSVEMSEEMSVEELLKQSLKQL